jgi:hypothetical protein
MEKIELKTSDGRLIGTVDAAEWNAMPLADRNAFIAQYEEKPTERARAAAQGALLGFSDELFAGLQAPFGEGSMSQNYEAALKNERDVLKQYRQDYPISSAAYEIGGAILPAVFTGGAAAPAAATRTAAVVGGLARGALSGAKTGAVYGFGTGEGGALDRAANMGVGALTGAGLGGALGTIGGTLKGSGGALMNWVRNKMGNRIAGVVSKEVQRLAEQGGLTADEVIEGVANGRIMAENRTLESMIRSFYSEGGPAGAEIKRVMSARPGETRKAAMDELQGALGSPGNPLANKRASEALTREAEDAAYEAAFKANGIELPAPPQIVAAMQDLAIRTPGALKDAAEVARVQYGIRPFFKELEDGTIEFARAPTLREAELTYRSLRDMKGAAYTGGRGTLGGALEDVATGFKGQIDVASTPLASARAKAAEVRSARDAFTAGQEAIRKSPDELALIIQDIEKLGPDAIAAFREGMLASVRAGMSRPSAAPGLMRGLSNEETGPGTALRLALPSDKAASVVQKIGTAERAQGASKYVLEGPSTAPTIMAPKVGGAVNTAEETIGAFDGGFMAWARLIGSAADSVKPGLSDNQKLEIARIVLSTDPALVARALKDDSAAAKLMEVTSRAVDMVVRAGTRGSASGLNLMIDNPSGND